MLRDEYAQLIQRFFRLIQCLLASTTAVSYAQNITKHVDYIQALVEQTEVLLVVNDIESIQ